MKAKYWVAAVCIEPHNQRPGGTMSGRLPTSETHVTEESVEALEARVHRLEQAVAALGDTQLMEDRVVERVARRLEPTTNGGLLGGVARRFRGNPNKDNPETGAAAHEDAPHSEPPLIEETPSATSRSAWVVWEFFREIRTMSRMFADYRYRFSWTGRVVPLSCFVIGVLSWFLIGGIPFIGVILDRLIDVVLIVVVYKALSREVERYRSGAGRVLR